MLANENQMQLLLQGVKNEDYNVHMGVLKCENNSSKRSSKLWM